MKPTCATCPFYAPIDRQCRVNAPQLLMLLNPINNNPQFVGTWPPTRESNWCGKHPDFEAAKHLVN